MELLTNIFTGSLGALFFLLWYAREYLKDNSWTWKIHSKENWKRWVWIWSILILTGLIYWVIPEAMSLMKVTTSFDIPELLPKVLFFGLGINYARVAKNLVNKVQ